MTEPSNGVSTREHFEEIIARIERSVTEQIGALREDIKHLQSNYVTRQEYDAVRASFEREITRLDKEIERVEKSSDNDLEDYKDDQREDRRNTIGIVVFVMGAVEFISRTLIK